MIRYRGTIRTVRFSIYVWIHTASANLLTTPYSVHTVYFSIDLAWTIFLCGVRASTHPLLPPSIHGIQGWANNLIFFVVASPLLKHERVINRSCSFLSTHFSAALSPRPITWYELPIIQLSWLHRDRATSMSRLTRLFRGYLLKI